MKLLITAGGTREPIDRVRSLANTSTGATGCALAAELAACGHSVELRLSASASAAPPASVFTKLPGLLTLAEERFSTTGDLERQLRVRLGTGDFEAVIMAAAVADYRPETSSAEASLGKIDSDNETLTLRLVRVPKLLPQLRGFSPRPLLVIGFKLTVGADTAARQAAIAKQFAANAVDAVVHNDLHEIEAAKADAQVSGAAEGLGGASSASACASKQANLCAHPFRFFTQPGASPALLPEARALARQLDQFLRARRAAA